MKIERLFVPKVVFYSCLTYFIYLLSLITIQYIPINYDVAFLLLKQDEIKLWYYKLAFFSHVFSSIVIITLGITQFSKTIRNRYTLVHRTMGRLYVLLVLFIASPSGLIMSLYANGGLVSQISFSFLSVLWFVFTLDAFLYIKKGEIYKHRDFMIRSYALTLSAISLRLFKYIIVTIFNYPPMDTYRIVSILGWTINLLIAEILIKKLNK